MCMHPWFFSIGRLQGFSVGRGGGVEQGICIKKQSSRVHGCLFSLGMHPDCVARQVQTQAKRARNRGDCPLNRKALTSTDTEPPTSTPTQPKHHALALGTRLCVGQNPGHVAALRAVLEHPGPHRGTSDLLGDAHAVTQGAWFSQDFSRAATWALRTPQGLFHA